MSEENIQELMDYNLEYMEAQQSEEIFGGDYTSAVDLKYANKQIEKLEKAMKDKSSYKDIIIENQQKKINKQKEVLDKIKEYCNHKLEMLELQKRNIMQILTPENGYLKTDIEIEMQKYKDILKLLEEIE